MKTYQVVNRAVNNKEAGVIYEKNHKFAGSDVIASRLKGWVDVGLVVQVDGHIDKSPAPAKPKTPAKPKPKAPAKKAPAKSKAPAKPKDDEVVDDVPDKPLSELSKTELKKIAKSLDIKKFSRMKEDELIEAIEEVGANDRKSSYELLSSLNRDDLEKAADEYNLEDDLSEMSDEDLVNAIWAAAGYESVNEDQDDNEDPDED